MAPILTTGAGRYPAIAAAGDAAETTAFLARADAITVVGATERAAYKALINGLVSTNSTISGTLFSRFDMLLMFATDTQAHALLNLVNSTYSASITSSPVFTADRGFASGGALGSVTTNFNPSTATTPKYTVNSAHMSLWNLTNATDASALSTLSTVGTTNIFPQYTDLSTYLRINDATNSSGFAIASPLGHFLGNRDSSTTRQGYRNAATVGSYPTVAAQSVVDNTVFNPVFVNSVGQNAMFSVGDNLSATDVTNFYNLLRTYMTAVGVP